MTREQQSRALDGMRGLAVLIVFLSHSSGRDMPLASWLQFQGIGHIGVYLFFVLSAYLLTLGLNNGVNATQFYIRRFFRIAPLYYIVLIGVLLYQYFGMYDSRYLHITLGTGLSHFLFLRGDGVFWTVAVEFTFYLVLPLMVYLINRLGTRAAQCAAVFFFFWYVMVMAGLDLPEPKLVSIMHQSQYFDVFLCGVLAAYLQIRLPRKTIAALFWATIILSLLLVSENFLGAKRPYYELRWISILYGTVFGLAIASVMQGNSFISGPLKNSVLVFMGKCAFGWYLLHFAVFKIVNDFGPESVFTRFLIATLGCALAAWGARILIEIPCIAAGRWLESTLRKEKTNPA